MLTPARKVSPSSHRGRRSRSLQIVLSACAAATLACGPSAQSSGGATTGQKVLLEKSRLGVFMKSTVNPPFSKISFLLFHNEDEPQEGVDPVLEIVKATNDLAESSQKLAEWAVPPTESVEAKTVFFEYAQNLQRDVQALQQALGAKDIAKAQLVFEELRRKCDSCHHFFRYQGETAASLDLPPLELARAAAGARSW